MRLLPAWATSLSLSRQVLSVTVFGLLLISLFTIGFQVRQYVDAEQDEIHDRTQALASVVEPVLLHELIVGDIEAVQQLVERIGGATRMHIRVIGVAQITPLAEFHPLETPSHTPAWFSSLLYFEPPVMKLSLSAGGVSYATLELRPSIDQIKNDIWSAAVRMVAISLLLLLIILAILSTTLRLGLRPLEDFSRAAERLGSGDFSGRLPEEGPLELALSAGAFNRMAGRLEELVGRLKASDAANRRLATIVEQSDEAILAADLSGNLVSWNPGAEKLFGYSAREMLGQPVLKLYPDGIPGGWEANLRRMRYGRSARVHEVIVRTANGQDLDVMMTTSPWNDESGNRLGEIAIAHDVSLRRAAERALLDAKETAENANRMKSEFLANMSHEIRTPMNGVLGMADLLMDTSLSAEQQEYVSLIKSSGDALMSIINDVLDLSKIEAGKLTLEPHPFNLPELVDEVVRLLGGTAKAKGLYLAGDPDPALPAVVVGDALRLRQVLVNLIGNAIKFTTAGGIRVRVGQVARDAASVSIRFDVIDTGIGIPRDKQDAIFRPFEQADGSVTRRFGGTGLGLSITSRLVGMMGGEVSVESTEGKGSTFYFTVSFDLPGASAPASDVPPAEAEQEASAQESSASAGKHVLVAEDNSVNRHLIERILNRLGHRVSMVVDGVAALEAMEAGGFDVVLMDVMMPRMGGYEATERWRERERGTGCHLPIIAVTANAFAEDRQQCLAAGMDDFIAKPYRIAEIEATLARIFPETAHPAA